MIKLHRIYIGIESS